MRLAELLITPAPRRGAPSTQGLARLGGLSIHCALGRGGVSHAKIEGDGCTPAGRFAIRRLLYRSDRIRDLACRLPMQPISPGDGWCDDPADGAYNRPVLRPYPASHEEMWREDSLYDLVLVIGHNDDPVLPGKGSAVFLHLAQPDYAPTAGCVAFARADFIALLAAMDPTTQIVVTAGESGA
jgi:L,D-peptidoglycan transpeptidase YkuD (ErfK/YbiS/YcfS/YnhG family)